MSQINHVENPIINSPFAVSKFHWHPESDAAFLKRVLCSRKGRSQSTFVMNDEAHHAYHPITSPPELGVLLTKALATVD